MAVWELDTFNIHLQMVLCGSLSENNLNNNTFLCKIHETFMGLQYITKFVNYNQYRNIIAFPISCSASLC